MTKTGFTDAKWAAAPDYIWPVSLKKIDPTSAAKQRKKDVIDARFMKVKQELINTAYRLGNEQVKMRGVVLDTKPLEKSMDKHRIELRNEA